MDLYPSSSLTPNAQVNPNTVIYDLQKTNGMAGARMVKTNPSSRVAIFDGDDDVFYIIQTDINNNKTINRYRFYEDPEPKPEDLFASKTEINELKGEISDVQQSIRELTEAITNALNNQNSSTDNVKSDRRPEEFGKKYVPKNKSEQQS